MKGTDVGVTGDVLEEHLPGEGVDFDVGEPRVRHGGDAVCQRSLSGHALGKRAEQLVAVDGEELKVEILL